MRAGRFRGEKKVKNGFCLQRAVNNSRKAFLRVHDFAGLQTVARFGGSRGVPADGARRLGGGWRSVGRRMVRGGHADGVRWHADSVRGDGRWSAEAPTDRGRKPAGGLRMARGDWWCRRMACGIVFSSLELIYFGKRNIYQAKLACDS